MKMMSENCTKIVSPGLPVLRSIPFLLSILLVTAFPSTIAQQLNVLSNPGFENGLSSWSAYGGASAVSVQSFVSHRGQFAALVDDRTHDYHGISTDVLGALSDRHSYTISAWFRLADVTASVDTVQMNMMQVIDDVTNYIPVGVGEITNTGWTKVEGYFMLNEHAPLPTVLDLVIEGPTPGVSFYCDDVSVVPNLLDLLGGYGGFEMGLAGWASFSGATVTVQSLVVRSGSKAALVSDRTQAYQGMGMNVMNTIAQGNIYVLSAWFRLAATTTADDNTVIITMMQEDNSGVVSYTQIGAGTVTSDGWTKVEGEFTLTVSEPPLTDLVLYFEGPAAGVDFYVDSVVLLRLEPVRDWRVETNEGIERNRMRDMRIEVVDSSNAAVIGATVRIRQVRRHFAFGTAVNELLLSDQQYRDFVEENFEWAVPEDQVKWYHTEQSQGVENYTAMDAMYAFCAERDIKMRGQNIFWADENFVQPWVKALDDDALRNAMETRIDSVVGRYAGKFEHWDVNNEMLRFSYFKDRLGDGIRPWMFSKTNEADSNAMRFVNDYDVVNSAQTDNYKKHIQELIDTGAQIDGIGVQGHFWRTNVDPYAVRARLDSLAELGLPIWITEYDSINSNQTIRADNLEKLYRTAFAHPAVGGVLMWGFYAGAQWLGPDAAIVDMDWTVNAAGTMFKALMEEWTTTGNAITGTDGVADLHGYHGKYEVEVESKDGAPPQSSVIYLAPGVGPGTFTIVLDKESPPAKVHIGEVNSVSSMKGKKWKPKLRFRIIDLLTNEKVNDVEFTVVMSYGNKRKEKSCTSNNEGWCQFKLNKIPLSTTSVKIGFVRASGDGVVYDGSNNSNHDGCKVFSENCLIFDILAPAQ